MRIKHAESGGYLTVDEDSAFSRAGRMEAYIRVYHGANASEEFTANQMFEIEKSQDDMEESGAPLTWEEDGDTGQQTVSVRLRHFNSGRLLQIILYKDETTMNQVLTLATGKAGELEEDGEGISSKKTLKKGGLIQNYVFKLINRATVDELKLSKDTVANIMNDSTKAFISTQFIREDTVIPDGDPDPNDEPLSASSDPEVAPG